MPRYNITAWCSLPHYATFEINARSVREALARAKIQVTDEYADPCNGGAYEWNEFEVQVPSGRSKWFLEPDRAMEIAAKDLLDAAILAEDVLSDLARDDDGTPSVSALLQLRAAIRKSRSPVGD